MAKEEPEKNVTQIAWDLGSTEMQVVSNLRMAHLHGDLDMSIQNAVEDPELQVNTKKLNTSM